ncbi:MAG: tRNA pseudouridine(55) synthase TruB, partial [Alphaproteobacteria bacterium]|nr:tRNA pseudouridine(55) synthase TruB [Alphaproteobacteria bacterium]
MNKSGWVIIDKPLGMTCTQVGGALRRLLGTKKIGHLGTLDPLASGVLAFAIGEATKAIPYYKNSHKIYEFETTWGEQRATDDAEGDITETSSVRPTLTEIESIRKNFIGDLQQIPPIYSAIKVNGKRSYKAAREGQDISLKARPITVYDLEILKAENQSCQFRATCGSGTYIRSLGRDMARALGTVGYISKLKRIKDGKFNVNDAISLESLEKIDHKERYQYIKPIRAVLDDIPAVPVSAFDAEKIQRGMAIKSDLDF